MGTQSTWGTFCLSILLPSPIKPLLCNMPTVDGEKRNQNEIIVSVKSSTVSKERLPMLDCDEYIQKPGIARANLAPSIEWGTTWLLIQKDGRVYREDIRQLYDAS